MKELKKYSLDSSRVGNENPESQKFRMFQDDGDYGPVSLPEIEIWHSGHGSSSDSDSWSDPWGHIRVILGVEATQVLIPVQEAIPVEGSSSGGTNTGFTNAERKRISTVALKYLGINERDNIELIKQWLRDAGYDKPINSTAWCAVFVSMFFREAQIESRINTTRVADWRTWGKTNDQTASRRSRIFPQRKSCRHCDSCEFFWKFSDNSWQQW